MRLSLKTAPQSDWRLTQKANATQTQLYLLYQILLIPTIAMELDTANALHTQTRKWTYSRDVQPVRNELFVDDRYHFVDLGNFKWVSKRSFKTTLFGAGSENKTRIAATTCISQHTAEGWRNVTGILQPR